MSLKYGNSTVNSIKATNSNGTVSDVNQIYWKPAYTRPRLVYTTTSTCRINPGTADYDQDNNTYSDPVVRDDIRHAGFHNREFRDEDNSVVYSSLGSVTGSTDFPEVTHQNNINPVIAALYVRKIDYFPPPLPATRPDSYRFIMEAYLEVGYVYNGGFTGIIVGGEYLERTNAIFTRPVADYAQWSWTCSQSLYNYLNSSTQLDFTVTV